jgi:hypothetical protein
MKEGWSIKVIEEVRGQPGGVGPVIPSFVRADGTNNGVWFHSGALWVQNEDTAKLPDLVQKLTFAEMLAAHTNPKRERGAETTLIGAAKIDITPDHPIRLTGYGGRKTESEGVEQKIWAKALAIGGLTAAPTRRPSDDSAQRLVDEPAKQDLAILITVDNLGIGWDTTQEVAARLAKKVGLKPERLAICASHTHTGPMLKTSPRTFLASTCRRSSRSTSMTTASCSWINSSKSPSTPSRTKNPENSSTARGRSPLPPIAARKEDRSIMRCRFSKQLMNRAS